MGKNSLIRKFKTVCNMKNLQCHIENEKGEKI